MVIKAKHFDTRLNQWIHTDNDTNNPNTLLQEELNNSLLEHFLPGKQFSFGHMDDKTKPEMLFNHPDGDVLLLSSKSRLLYGEEECLETIQKLCPDNKDRGAYGSIFLGSCKNAVTKELNILVVDDSNGENGGIINNEQAYRLTGDCYGQISTELYHELTKHQEGDPYRVIQHRFGWTDQDGDDNKFRFGKGTLRPANLDQILNYQDSNQQKVDLILPLSAFKGTDKDNHNQPTKPQIKPGLYKQNIWLGEKSQSELGKTAISQMIASFPNGVKDFTEQIELEAKKLHTALDDPRKIAQIYCQKYEKRKQFLETQAQELEEEAIENPQLGDELEKLRSRIATDTNIYKLIKTDLEGSGQLLETEKVQQELARFVQNEWKEIAIGKSLTFERAMVIPSKDLQNGEISIPHYQDGEEVLNFRSPFLNSNGLCVSSNKVVEDIAGPDGKPLAGVIAVSDETSERIYNRLNSQIKSIRTETQGENLQLEGIENYLDQNIGKLETKEKIEFTSKFNEYIKELQSAGYLLEILPQESEQERQGRDYDGDCIGFEQASKYPNLTVEAIERNLPENAYDPTVKLKKQSFYRQDGSQPEFEEIAIHMSDGISVGVINNHLTSIEALESEITILKNFGSEKDQVKYVQQVAKHYEELFQKEAIAANRGMQGKEIPDKYRGYMSEFVQTARQEPLTQANILASLGTNTQMYREMIASAAFQNQIAVDLFKSAKKPEMDIIRSNSRILHREVNYIKDKKKDVYVNSTIKPTGYSPVELLIAKTNQYFEKASLESRYLVEFSKLFHGIEFSNQQKLEATLAKKEFDILFNAASRASSQKKVEPGPSANIKLPNGNNLIVTNLLRYDNESIYHADNIKIKIADTDPEKQTKERPHEYLVYAQINEERGNNGEPKFQPIGTLAQSQEKLLDKLGIDYGKPIQGGKITFQPEISEGQIDLLFKQAYQKAEEFYQSVPVDEKLQMAAAAWSVATTRESSESTTKKISNFAFAAFSKEIIDRQKELQFTEFTLTGHKYNNTSEVLNPENIGSPQEIRFNIAEQTNSKGITEIKGVIEFKNAQDEYQTFGNINALDAKLPIGTTANGTFEIDKASTATVTTKVPGLPEITFKVNDLQKFNHNNRYDNASMMMTIENTKIVRDEYSIYIKEGSQDVKLGVLDDKSVKEGVASGWLKEKTDTGQALQLKLQTVTTGNNAYAIAENSNGDLMRVNITNETYKKKTFNDSELRPAKVIAYDKKHVYIAKIGDKTIGIIGQHTERVKAEIFKNKCSNISNSKYKPKSSTPQVLINNCILKENQTRTTIPVQITTNETTCTLSIDPETVKYPDKWVKRSHLIDNKSEISETEQRAKQIFDKIGERPTLMFQNKEMVLTNKVGLAIDEKLADKTQKYLDKQNIKYEQLPESQSKLETKKGMTVFVIDESTIIPENKNIFIERAGGTIKNNEEYKAALNSIPNRSKILSLEDIPVLITPAKPSQDAELPQNTNIPETPKNENKVVEENELNTSTPQQDAAVKNQAASSTATSLPSSPVTIGPNSKDGLGAALAPDTVKAKENGTVENDYSIRFNQNIYPDVKQACLHQKQLQPQTSTLQIMTEVIQAKLEQHPRLTKEITNRGGVEWLNSCEAIGNSNNAGWDGIGNQSALINAIAQAYTNVIEKQNNLQNPDIPAFSPPDSLPQSTPKSAPEPTPQSTPKSIPKIKTGNQTIKVISGGQTGADMGGLIGAKALGLPTSGIAAYGWMTENGANPKLQDYGLIEGEKGASIKESYAKRTIANIKESDGTIILGDINSTGSKLTLDVAKKQNKPTLAIPLKTVLSDKVGAAKLIEDFVRENNIQTLNVAGNRESVAPGLQAATAEIVLRGLAPIVGKEGIKLNDTPSPQNSAPAQTLSNSINTSQQLETEPGINITSRSDDPFGCVLTATTYKSKQVGTIEGDYLVYYRDNKAMPAGQQGPEFYDEAKPAGQPFLSAQQAFHAYKEEYKPGEPMVKLMTDILQARYEQHPDITEEITARGGVEWLKKCSYIVTAIDPENPDKKANFWEGEGLKSPYIRALTTAYSKVIELNQVSTAARQENSQQLQSNNDNLTGSASLHIPNSQFSTPPSINNESDTEQQVYEHNDQLENALNSTSGLRQKTGAMDSIIEKMKANTVQTLQNWYVASQQLGKSERYLNRINEVTEDYIKDNISLHKAFASMDDDIKNLSKINEITALAQKITNTFGSMDVNGITSVQTESYKNYKIATKAQDKTYLIKDKDDNVLLYVKQGTTQVNNLNDDVIRDFRFMQYKIDNSLQDTRKELVER